MIKYLYNNRLHRTGKQRRSGEPDVMENNMKLLEKSERLIQWTDNLIDGIEISSDDRSRIAAGCFDIALENQKSIILLINKKLYGSAFSLVRVQFEAYVRGLWL